MTDWLDAVRRAAEAVDRSQMRLRDAVAAARQHGALWKDIGATLGVSRQAAQQRFKGIK